MHSQPIHPAAPVERPANGIVVATGYGLKLYVQRGHLHVHDGLGRHRRTRRYSRAMSKLKRVVVVGHTGFVTLEALRWIRDVGATFVQLGADSELVAVSAPARHHESKLRRAQALAGGTETGRLAIVQLLRAKLEAQAQLAERHATLKPTVRNRATREAPTVADVIRAQAETLTADRPFGELRLAESIAGRAYWQLLARLPLTYDRAWAATVPDHWHTAGPRTSYLDRKRARLAQTPAHAIFNYLYAILETEATIAAHALGLDPALGIMHTDQRYRGSLATDLMEPGRPVADQLAIDLLTTSALQRGDVFETRRGVCRLGASLTRQLAHHAPALRSAVAAHAERLARTLLHAPDHPTPLTRRRHQQSLGAAPAGG